MKRLVLIVAMLFTMSFAVNASAQCAKNILSDDSFVDASCYVWSYSGAAARKTDNLMCGGFPTYVEISGSAGTGIQPGSFSQTATANTNGSQFYLSYVINFSGQQNTYWQDFAVYIEDASNNTVLATADHFTGYIGALNCVRRDINLGLHSDWRGKSLRIRFEGYAYYGAVFKVGMVSLRQSN